jgi:hypothetical protein
VINWWLGPHPNSYWLTRGLLFGCTGILLAVADLPHNTVDRVIALIAVAAVAVIFLLWLARVLILIVHPRLPQDMLRRRMEATMRMQRDVKNV